MHVVLFPAIPGLSKAETQALTNYGSGEDENEEEEMEEFEAGPIDVQTSLQASADGQMEQEVCMAVNNTFKLVDLLPHFQTFVTLSSFRGCQAAKPRRPRLKRRAQSTLTIMTTMMMMVRPFFVIFSIIKMSTLLSGRNIIFHILSKPFLFCFKRNQQGCWSCRSHSGRV